MARAVGKQPVGHSEHVKMAIQALRKADFKETYAVHSALRAGLKSKLFSSDAGALTCGLSATRRSSIRAEFFMSTMPLLQIVAI